MAGDILKQEGLSAVVVGNGSIGLALAANLLQRENLNSLVILNRNGDVPFSDPRVANVKFDAEAPESIAAAAKVVRSSVDRVHLMINTVGMLHNQQQQPEKRLSRVSPENLQRSFAVNTMLLPVLVQEFSSLLRHLDSALFVSLSARVGSIEDNRLGGWYSYRASKAAHNMLLRTIAQEWRLSHRNAAIVAMHPGTVASRLSEPFISSGYQHTVHTPSECADHLAAVFSTLTSESSGSFLDWRGQPVPW
ncbi:SDR family NAD(P)-dependent oxidoreductase [Halioglobus maricola]|nr:SDR family NAD(P)-dependent oxidoreductase [Halioglobus maricola]